MKPDDSKNAYSDDPYHISGSDSSLDTDACTECTGLMYRGPANREEWESYLEVFDFLPKAPGDSGPA